MTINDKFQHFSDETTIHAIKDFFYGNKLGKVFWGTLAILAVVGLALQLEGVIFQYTEEETGSTMTEYSPATLPAFSICPDTWVDKVLADQHGIGSAEASIIGGFMGFAGVSELFAISGGSFPERVKSAMKYKICDEKTFKFMPPEVGCKKETKYSTVMDLWKQNNNTIEGMVEAVGLKQINTLWATIYPMDANFTSTRTITMSGVCYKYEVDIAINQVQSTHAGIKFAFNLPASIGPDVYEDEPYFRVVMGPTDEIDVASTTLKTFRYGNHYVILYSMMKVTRVSTRKWPCRDWSRGDVVYCTNYHGNKVTPGKKVVHKDLGEIFPDGCKSALPRSDYYEAVKTEYPCNTFINIVGSSMIEFAKIMKTDSEWNKLCPRPCSFTTYQYTYQLEKENISAPVPNASANIYTILEFKKEEGMSGMLIKEYLIMGVSGMLSNIGGTLGLWIGASVMSLVQIFYVFVLERWMAKKPVKQEK